MRQDGSEPSPAATTQLEGRARLADQLARLGAHGELLLYAERCELTRFALPSLERTGEDDSGCAPRGAESPDRSTIARCLGDEVELFHAGGGFVRSLPGCAPAWQPDGTLTVARNRAIVRFRPCADGRGTCTSTVIAPAELERAARRHPTSPALAPLRVLVDGIAWLSQRRAAVLLSIRLAGRFAGMGPMGGVAFFENGRAEETQTFFRRTGGRLDVSPLRTYVTLTPDVILRTDGTQVSLPPHLRAVRELTWSPDERFLAVVTRFAVTVLDVASLERYDTIGSGLRSVTLPVRVSGLAWR